MKSILEYVKKEKLIITLLVLLIGYSLFIVLLAKWLGIHRGDIYKGYHEKTNWCFFALFWIPALYFCKATWSQFIAAWNDLFRNGCIKSDKGAVSSQHREKFIIYITRYRVYIIILSALLALVIMHLDMREINKIYWEPGYPAKITRITISNDTTPKELCFHSHLEPFTISCFKKNVDKKALYYINELKFDDARKVESVSLENAYNAVSRQKKGSGYDKIKDISWAEACIFDEFRKGEKIGRLTNYIFVLLAYAQQYVIIIIGLVALFQMWAHLAFFSFFNYLPVAQKYGLRLQLDPYSPIHEFGLERWNQALNIIYWILCPILVIPIISKVSQYDPGYDDIGQQMIQWLVPLLFITPMIFTIISRQIKVMELWESIRKADESKIERYHNQLLWPLDKNWTSKLGIIMAFLLLVYLIGDILTRFGAHKLIHL